MKETKLVNATTWIDEGPPGYNASAGTPTREDKGLCPVAILSDLPGANSEHLMFEQNCTGRMTYAEWVEFCKDIQVRGIQERIFVWKEKDGTVQIAEGNHRLRAAIEIGMDRVPVEIRYFGNSQRGGLVI